MQVESSGRCCSATGVHTSDRPCVCVFWFLQFFADFKIKHRASHSCASHHHSVCNGLFLFCRSAVQAGMVFPAHYQNLEIQVRVAPPLAFTL